jgi:hypothetical protein
MPAFERLIRHRNHIARHHHETGAMLKEKMKQKLIINTNEMHCEVPRIQALSTFYPESNSFNVDLPIFRLNSDAQSQSSSP